MIFLGQSGTFREIVSRWKKSVHFELLEFGLCDFTDNSDIKQMTLIHGGKLKLLAIRNCSE